MAPNTAVTFSLKVPELFFFFFFTVNVTVGLVYTLHQPSLNFSHALLYFSFPLRTLKPLSRTTSIQSIYATTLTPSGNTLL